MAWPAAIGAALLALLRRLGMAALAFLGRLIAKWGIRRIVTALIAWGIIDEVVDLIRLLEGGDQLARDIEDEAARQATDPMRQEDTTAVQHDIESVLAQLERADRLEERRARVSADEARSQAESALEELEELEELRAPDQVVELRHTQARPTRETQT